MKTRIDRIKSGDVRAIGSRFSGDIEPGYMGGGGGSFRFEPFGDGYISIAKSISGLIAGYAMNEENSDGTAVKDFSGNSRNAVSEQIVYGAAGVSGTCFQFNGLTGYLDFYSASLNAALNLNESTFSWWVKTPLVGVWSDSTARNFLRINNASGNALDVRKTATANEVQVNLYCDPMNLIGTASVTPSTGWIHFCLAISKSNNRITLYIDGVSALVSSSFTTAWSGALSSSAVVFGALSKSNQQVWNGCADNLLIYGRELSSSEAAKLATYTPVIESRKSFMAFGDSKVVGQNDTQSVFGNGNNGWPTYLADVSGMVQLPRIAVSGRTWATAAAAVDAELALYAYVPDYIFVNIGANDVLALPDQAVIEADIAYVLDALHAKYPSKKIYVDSTWRSGTDSESALLSGYTSNVILSRAWAAAGLKESSTLKSTDDGATYYDDGVHYNHAGHVYFASLRSLSL